MITYILIFLAGVVTGYLLAIFLTGLGRQSDAEIYQEGIFYRDLEIKKLKETIKQIHVSISKDIAES